MSFASENPFRTSRLLDLPAPTGAAEDEALLARWRAAGRRGALVGPHGCGKTARMRALAARLATEGWRIVWARWHDDGTTTPADWRAALRPVDARTLVCLDGLENLGPVAAYRLFRYTRRAGGRLATLHRPSWFWPTLARHAPDEAVFVAHAVALAPACEPAARAAFAAARGNAHEAFRRLYLDWASPF
jgi:hypothetical protein